MQNRVAATEFKNRTGQYLEVAARKPVVITRFGRPIRVMLDIEDFEALQKAATTQRRKTAGLENPAKRNNETPDLQNVLSALRDHMRELREAGVNHVSVFGSVARGDAGPNSDVDLLVEFMPGHHVGLAIVSLKDRLAEIVGAAVDVVRGPLSAGQFASSIEAELVHAF